MKKYILRDTDGSKKTIYAKNLIHALSMKDAKEIKYKNATINQFGQFEFMIEGFGETYTSLENAKLAVDELIREGVRFSDTTIVDNNAKDEIRTEFVPEKVRKIAEMAAKKVNATVKYDGFDKHITVYFEPKSSIISNNFEETLNKELSKYGWKIGSFGRNGLSFYAKDSIKDEASELSSLQALITDEEAAIKAYSVAINNLKGKIDDTSLDVLKVILADERRHVENLYAIINGQVTEKNLKDSNIKDGINEAKKLVEQAGFKVKNAYGTDNEPYITVDWDGSYSELQKKVKALQSEAKKIGYKSVYADDNDICFSKW